MDGWMDGRKEKDGGGGVNRFSQQQNRLFLATETTV
jgi:hypothetical protein